MQNQLSRSRDFFVKKMKSIENSDLILSSIPVTHLSHSFLGDTFNHAKQCIFSLSQFHSQQQIHLPASGDWPHIDSGGGSSYAPLAVMSALYLSHSLFKILLVALLNEKLHAVSLEKHTWKKVLLLGIAVFVREREQGRFGGSVGEAKGGGSTEEYSREYLRRKPVATFGNGEGNMLR